MDRISNRTRTLALILALVGCLAAAPAGRAQEPRQPVAVDFRLALTNPAPGSPSGLDLHVEFLGDEKPPALRSAVYELPSGTRLDTATLSKCMASDAEFQLGGASACPAESRLTIGSFTGITGFGPPLDPFQGDLHVFNGPNQLIEVITFPGSSLSPAFDRLTIDGSTLTAHPPTTPGGPPDGESVPTYLDFSIPAIEGGGRRLVTTPETCPPGGQWTSTGTFGFADGRTNTVRSTTRCQRASSMKLSVHPRRAPVGERVRFRVQARSDDPDCSDHVRVRIGRHKTVTDSRGQATISARFRRAGLRRLAANGSCGRATAAIRLVRRRAAIAR